MYESRCGKIYERGVLYSVQFTLLPDSKVCDTL